MVADLGGVNSGRAGLPRRLGGVTPGDCSLHGKKFKPIGFADTVWRSWLLWSPPPPGFSVVKG